MIENKKIVIVSVLSDIAIHMASHFLCRENVVVGMTRHPEKIPVSLAGVRGFVPIKVDISSGASISKAINRNEVYFRNWDFLIFATGTQFPVGPFEKVGITDWISSINVNALGQLSLLHSLLPYRTQERDQSPHALFFAGAGSNDAPPNYSSYIGSKIFLTKMVEILSEEILDLKTTIIGPGWVKTKIHDETLKVGASLAGKNYEKTLEQLQKPVLTDIADIIRTFEWCMSQPKNIVSGRNFSVVHDSFDEKLIEELKLDTNMYKLRRFKNDWRKADDF